MKERYSFHDFKTCLRVATASLERMRRERGPGEPPPTIVIDGPSISFLYGY